MDNLIEKLIYAFLGGLVALILKSISEKFNRFHITSNNRKILKTYLNTIVIGKSKLIIKECDRFLIHIGRFDIHEFQKAINKEAFDNYPMLNSKTINSFTLQELRRIARNEDTFILLYSLAYLIDFQMKSIPIKNYNEFKINLQKHFDNHKGDKNFMGIEDHYKRCGTVNNMKKTLIANVKANRKRSKENIEIAEALLKRL